MTAAQSSYVSIEVWLNQFPPPYGAVCVCIFAALGDSICSSMASVMKVLNHIFADPIESASEHQVPGVYLTLGLSLHVSDLFSRHLLDTILRYGVSPDPHSYKSCLIVPTAQGIYLYISNVICLVVVMKNLGWGGGVMWQLELTLSCNGVQNNVEYCE